jgi:uncharacterized protein
MVTAPDATALSRCQLLDVGIPMRDGLELAADVHLPSVVGPAPAIVVGTPYGKRSEQLEVDAFVPAGYAVVAYDCRGRGSSEGVFRAFVNDPTDGHDVIEWVAAQPWCDGRVGITGLSYGGWIVWATASQRPPHLRAAVSVSAAGRWMQEIPALNGCFQLFMAAWLAGVRRRVPDRLRDVQLLEVLPLREIGERIAAAGPTWDDLMEHDALDGLWRSLRWDGDYGRFDLPCLHVTGWHDREDLHGAFHHYEHMLAESPAADRQWLVVGPWSHVSCRTPTDAYDGVAYPRAAIDMNRLHLRFFDRFLRERRNGFETEPRVRLYDPGARGWRVHASWRREARVRRLHLAAGRRLTAAPEAPAADAYRYDPAAAPGLRFDVLSRPWEPSIDLSELEAQQGVLAWSGEPLEKAFTLHGWSRLDLYASTDGTDTDWHVKLADVDEDGVPRCVAWGCLRASHAHDLSAPRPVARGAVERYEVELSPAFHTFAAGHRVRVLLASADFPWFARSMNCFGSLADQERAHVARNVVHHGTAHPSALCLPVERDEVAANEEGAS